MLLCRLKIITTVTKTNILNFFYSYSNKNWNIIEMASAPQELSFDEILKFMLAHNGKVTNHELVKHFKAFLTNPNMRDEARNTFKKHVNTLASIKTHNNEKWLLLKKKYYPGYYDKENSDMMVCNQSSTSLNSLVTSPVAPPTTYVEENKLEPIPYRPPPPFPHYNVIQDVPPPVPPHLVFPEPIPPEQINKMDQPKNMYADIPVTDDVPPKAFPRKKAALERANSSGQSSLSQPQSPFKTPEQPIPLNISDPQSVDDDFKISVKERKQMFNRMASEGDIVKTTVQPGGQTHTGHDADEEDRASVHKGETEPLDAKQKTWILCAARGDYHTLAKLCSENPKLARTKDPFTGYTAMHWACKRGNENVVKLIAGAARNTVNERSNGGYTPLHIAMQFRHENVYRLLVEVYEADQNMRDWAGKKPRQYFAPIDTTFTPGLYRKKEGFLRIGSLNVRVKKTTEAFSNFLGVGATRSSAYVPKSYSLDERREEIDLLHKSWGSADNIPKKDKLMPPPNSTKVRRRGTSSRSSMSNSRSTPSTPDQPRSSIVSGEGDSDSDSAAGFHSAWRQ